VLQIDVLEITSSDVREMDSIVVGVDSLMVDSTDVVKMGVPDVVVVVGVILVGSSSNVVVEVSQSDVEEVSETSSEGVASLVVVADVSAHVVVAERSVGSSTGSVEDTTVVSSTLEDDTVLIISAEVVGVVGVVAEDTSEEVVEVDTSVVPGSVSKGVLATSPGRVVVVLP
jgi:hypothetical protein